MTNDGDDDCFICSQCIKRKINVNVKCECWLTQKTAEWLSAILDFLLSEKFSSMFLHGLLMKVVKKLLTAESVSTAVVEKKSFLSVVRRRF